MFPPPLRHPGYPGDSSWRRFWPKVRIAGPDDCWEWQGALAPTGYGNFGVHAKRHLSAHKAAFLLAVGPVPEGRVLMHSCDNRRCCNPAHLSVGTYRDNTQDGIRKGRISHKPTGGFKKMELAE